MISIHFSELRKNLKRILKSVEENNETLIIKRKSGKAVVLLSQKEYNSIMETLYLLSSGKNADRLYESIKQMEMGNTVRGLLELDRP